MEDTEFHARADTMLEQLESMLETADIEADLLGGILTISAANGQFVLNKHGPTKQLWLASPLSGAARFACEGGQWRHTVTGEELEAFIQRELQL